MNIKPDPVHSSAARLRILVVEDSADDVALLVYALRRAGIEPDYIAVDTIADLQAQLARQRWDIVLADHNVPGTSFAAILKTSKDDDPDRPVIVVSGSIGEETAVELMRSGVADLILKHNLSRLGPAILREVTAARQQHARREADERFRNVAEVTGEWIWETDRTHRFIYFSESMDNADWLSATASLSKTRWDLDGAEPIGDPGWQQHRAALEARQPFRNYRMSFRRGDRRHYLATSGVPYFDRDGTWLGYRGMARDETAIIEASRRAEEAEALLRDAVESISEGFIILDANDRVVLANDAYKAFFPEVSSLIEPGVRFQDIVMATLANGSYPDAVGHETEWLAERMAEHRRLNGSHVYRLRNDRWLMVSERRMRNGGTAGLRMDITALRNVEAERDYLALHDAITGLPNQAHFSEHLSRALSLSGKTSRIVVLSLELTSLTDIRASQGLEAGDAALRETGRRLVAGLPQGMVAHIGNGRFLAFSALVDGDEEVLALVQRLIDGSDTAFTVLDVAVPLRLVAGGCLAQSGEEPETLIRNATTALSERNANPLQRFQFYAAEMTTAAIHRWTIESDLRQAIERQEFVLHYQPQVDAHSHRIVGAEALIRWAHPDRGLIPPSQFIPIAEETGLIVPLGEYGLRTACAEARNWRNDRGLGVPVAVNISAVQLAESDLETLVTDILEQTGLPAQMLKLELTESAILGDTAAATRTMNSLAERGVRFALDDFGMQYSSLSLLSHLPLETLKVDYAFVSKMTEGRAHAGLVQAIISMTHSLGMVAVAEGVERSEQLTYLQAYGCDVLQGFLFSKAVPAEAMRALLAQGSIVPRPPQ